MLAGHTALENFWHEQKGKNLSRLLLNTSDDQPIFEIKNVTELDSFDGIENLNLGLIFYSESEQDKEQ